MSRLTTSASTPPMCGSCQWRAGSVPRCADTEQLQQAQRLQRLASSRTSSRMNDGGVEPTLVDGGSGLELSTEYLLFHPDGPPRRRSSPRPGRRLYLIRSQNCLQGPAPLRVASTARRWSARASATPLRPVPAVNDVRRAVAGGGCSASHGRWFCSRSGSWAAQMDSLHRSCCPAPSLIIEARIELIKNAATGRRARGLGVPVVEGLLLGGSLSMAPRTSVGCPVGSRPPSTRRCR